MDTTQPGEPWRISVRAALVAAKIQAVTHTVVGAVLAPSFFYLLLSPSGETTLFDAVEFGGGELDYCGGQIYSLVGWNATTTSLLTPVGRLLVVHAHDAAHDADDEVDAGEVGQIDNPIARHTIIALGGPDRTRRGPHVFCAAGPENTLAGLTCDQVEMISSAIRQQHPIPLVAHLPV